MYVYMTLMWVLTQDWMLDRDAMAVIQKLIHVSYMTVVSVIWKWGHLL